MGSPAPTARKALNDATKRWPHRNKASDGIMGDTAHQQRRSDHNAGNAFDLTRDPVNGPDCNVWSQIVISDPRVTYVIWNSKIYVVSRGEWRNYTGSNPHNKHMHVSIHETSRNDLAPWPWSPESQQQEGKKNTTSEGNNSPRICYPILKKNGEEFGSLDEILAHLEGENTGMYLIARNNMWHGGIHISNITTPWCALSGKNSSEETDFPDTWPYKGEQFVRCMADGEVVAYRVCKDYLDTEWMWKGSNLYFSGSFLLVHHHIQPGKTADSGLHFYTLYMHLAPWSAYEATANNKT